MRTGLVLAIDLLAGLAWLVVGLVVMGLIGGSLQSGLAQDDPQRADIGAWAGLAGLVVASTGMFLTLRLVRRRFGEDGGTRRNAAMGRWAPGPGSRWAGPGPARRPGSGAMPALRPNTLRQGVVPGGWTKPASRTTPANQPRFAPARPPSPFASPRRVRPGSRATGRVAQAGAVVMALVAGLLLLGAAAEKAAADLWLPIPFLVLAGMLLAAGGTDVRDQRFALRGAAVFVAPLLLGIAATPSSADSILLAAAILFVGAVLVIGIGRTFGRGLTLLLRH